ncbi:MAG: hypothetical protein ACLP8S_12245 [Solirubrobacteraceae bacterium]
MKLTRIEGDIELAGVVRDQAELQGCNGVSRTSGSRCSKHAGTRQVSDRDSGPR